VTLAQRLDVALKIDPNAPAILHAGAWWTWSTAAAVAAETADVAALDRRSSGAVGVVLRNVPEVLAALVGLLIEERTVVPVSPLQSDSRLSAEIEHLQLAVVIADEQTWGREGVIAAARKAGSAGVTVSASGLRTIVEQASFEDRYPATPGVAVQMATSGTTGQPRRIALKYASLDAAIDATRHYSSKPDTSGAPRLSSSTNIVAVPMVHISGFYSAITGLAAGRRVALMERFDAADWAELVHLLGPPAASLPPTCVRMLYEANVDPSMLTSLRALRVGSAPLDVDLAVAFEERYAVPILTVYGATEFNGAVIGWTLPTHEKWITTKRGSAGLPHPGIDVRIVNPLDGEELQAGETGLLEVRGAQIQAPEGSWVRTQDRASIDPDGFVWIKGRADDTLIRGGFKVSMAKVCSVLEDFPGIREAVVVARPDQRLGEVPAAVVEAQDPIDREALRAWCKEQLAPYEVPVAIEVVDRLPRNAGMKVARERVVELLDHAAKGATHV
jgi:long-chain acyl-CoA synthetase